MHNSNVSPNDARTLAKEAGIKPMVYAHHILTALRDQWWEVVCPLLKRLEILPSLAPWCGMTDDTTIYTLLRDGDVQAESLGDLVEYYVSYGRFEPWKDDAPANCRILLGVIGDNRRLAAAFTPIELGGFWNVMLLAPALQSPQNRPVHEFIITLRTDIERLARYYFAEDSDFATFVRNSGAMLRRYMSYPLEERRSVSQSILPDFDMRRDIRRFLQSPLLRGAPTVSVVGSEGFITVSAEMQVDRGEFEDVCLAAVELLHGAQELTRLHAHISATAINISVRDSDPRTGSMRLRHMLGVTAERADILSIAFERVQIGPCLAHLKARIPVDWTYGSLAGVASSIDEAPTPTQIYNASNIVPAEMSPAEFEDLIAALLSALGLETQQTLKSWDGGVDCLATDPRPIVGFTAVVQAKRYAGTVDASAVRDLFGTVQHRGVNKGILITTGTFGPTSREFARGKPIELIDGVMLRSLIEQLRADK